MAFCKACGKVRWRPEIQPVTGCRCATREPGQLRAAVEAALVAKAAKDFTPRPTPVEPVQLELPERPSLRALVELERVRRGQQ